MNLQYQMPMTPNSGSQWKDTTHIGYQPPTQQGWGIGSTMPQAPQGGGMPQQQDIMQNPLVQKQLSGWDQARQQNQGGYNSTAGYLKGFAQPISPALLAQMKSSNAALAKGGADNAFRSEQSLLNQGGQGDASSMAAARDEANRMGLGAAVNANSQLGQNAALANNAAGMQVGQSLLSSLPQYRADDYSGLLALQQNQNWMQQQQQNGMPSPVSPGMSNGRPSVGGKGPQQDQGFGFGGFGSMPPPPPTSRPNQPTQDYDNPTNWWM